MKARIILTLMALTALLPLTRAQQYSEACDLLIDRTTFFTGESIHYSAFISDPTSSQKALSTVLYVDLVDQHQAVVARCKTAIQDGVSSGAFPLDASIPSGFYLLRAYTWQQLTSAGGLPAVAVVEIIHPDLPVSGPNRRPDLVQNKRLEVPDEAVITHENGRVILQRNSSLVAFSLVKQSLLNPLSLPTRTTLDNPLLSGGTIAETRSVSLVGKCLKPGSSEVIPDLQIAATTLGESPQLHIERSDENGLFYVNLRDIHGTTSIYISPLDDTEVDLEIQSDLAPPFYHITWRVAAIDSNRIAGLNQAYIDFQIQEALQEKQVHEIAEKVPHSVLTDPSHRIYTADYVSMPDMRTVLNELVPYVNVRGQGADVSLHIQDPSHQYALNRMVIMVDMIPLTDVQAVLNLAPSMVDRIDVFNEPVALGDVVIEGLISIYTKDGKLGGIKLPTSTIVVDYPGLMAREKPAVKLEKNISNTLLFKVLNSHESNLDLGAIKDLVGYELLLYYRNPLGEIQSIVLPLQGL
jgi:hypothetical protein